MAVKRNTLSGALVPVAGPDGGVVWQSWTYGELTQHLTNDLFLDDFTPPSSLSWTPAWTPPTLVGAWTNLGSGTLGAGYLKDPLRVVHLRGRMAVGVNGSVAFTLPVGFRPEGNDTYAAAGYNGATSVAAFANILGNGSVNIFYTAGTVDVGLGGINFVAAL